MARPILLSLAVLAGLSIIALAVAVRVGANDTAQTPPPEPPPSLSKQIGRLAAQVTLGAEHGALFYAYDTLAYPGQPIDLTARLQRSEDLLGVAGAELGFYLGDAKVGSAVTDERGFATTQFTPDKDGDYTLLVRLERLPEGADPEMLSLQTVPLYVLARPREAKIALVDLDHTVVQSAFYAVLLGAAEPMPDAARVLHDLTQTQQLTLVYLTHRPNLLARRSKQWLQENHFPLGVLMMSTLELAIGGGSEFKAMKVSELRQSFPNVVLAVSDKPGDVTEFQREGIQSYLIVHYDRNDAKDMYKLARKIERLDPSIQVVGNWRELAEGVNQGRRFPPAAFAAALRQDANQVTAEED